MSRAFLAGSKGLSFAPAFRVSYPECRADATMKITVIIHKAEEGGYWAEVPAIPGCATQGETMEELLANVREAVEGCLSIPV